jgi:hypothetical protein
LPPPDPHNQQRRNAVTFPRDHTSSIIHHPSSIIHPSHSPSLILPSIHLHSPTPHTRQSTGHHSPPVSSPPRRSDIPPARPTYSCSVPTFPQLTSPRVIHLQTPTPPFPNTPRANLHGARKRPCHWAGIRAWKRPPHERGDQHPYLPSEYSHVRGSDGRRRGWPPGWRQSFPGSAMSPASLMTSSGQAEMKARLTPMRALTLLHALTSRQYLLESNFKHTAFTLLSESALPSTPLFQQFNPGYPLPPSQRPASNLTGSSRTNGVSRASASEPFGAPQGKIARGELIRKLWKALRWEEIERHTTTDTVCSAIVCVSLTLQEASAAACHSPFQLLVPHVCSPEGGSPAPAVPSPPPRRPDTFPPQHSQEPHTTDQGGNSPPPPRDLETTPTLAIGKGKRKSAGDAPASAKAADLGRGGRTASPRHGPTDASTPSTESGIVTPASKRIRDDDRRKAKGDDPKDAKLARGAKSSGIVGLAASEGSSWTEHRDAVSCSLGLLLIHR